MKSKQYNGSKNCFKREQKSSCWVKGVSTVCLTVKICGGENEVFMRRLFLQTTQKARMNDKLGYFNH